MIPEELLDLLNIKDSVFSAHPDQGKWGSARIKIEMFGNTTIIKLYLAVGAAQTVNYAHGL